MKHGQNNNRRQRSRGNPRRYPNQKGGSFESNGPEAKVRGTAQQVLEKYQALARDAYSAGDRILAEGYLQHAEHYYRILNSENEQSGRDPNRNRQFHGNRDEDMNQDDDMDNDSQSGSSNSRDEDDGNQDDDAGNGLHRTVSRGRNGQRRQPDGEASGNVAARDDSAAEDDSNTQQEADAGGESNGGDEAAEAPRKPRARRPCKTEQPVVEATDQSAAD
jgi:hypothetical protein